MSNTPKIDELLVKAVYEAQLDYIEGGKRRPNFQIIQDSKDQLYQLLMESIPKYKPEMSDAMWDFPDTLEGKMQSFDIASNEKYNRAIDETISAINKLFGKE